MPYVMTVVKIGGCLTVTIPKRLARELGILARSFVTVERGAGRALVVTPTEDYVRDRRELRGDPHHPARRVAPPGA